MAKNSECSVNVFVLPESGEERPSLYIRGSEGVAREIYARTAAEAPAMLEALRDVSDFLADHGYVPPCLSKARAIIARIEA